MTSPVTWLLGLAIVLTAPLRVEVPRQPSGEVDLATVVERLARDSGLNVPRPMGSVLVPVDGLAGGLTRTLLTDVLGRDVLVTVRPDAVVFEIPRALTEAAGLGDWGRRVRALADRATREARRRALRYGFTARPSYRPNDPDRPTICLVHGLNSNSTVFIHWFKLLEDAGFGVVVHDFPANRDLDTTCREFARDWVEFRRRVGERRPWSIVSHSMGALLVRSYLEDPEVREPGMDHVVMIAPVNQGSYLARAQGFYQWIQGLQATNGRRNDLLMVAGDGLGKSAEDMLPDSRFLAKLNARPRRAGVGYHIIAGDRGLIAVESRRRIEAQAELIKKRGGLVGRLVRVAAPDLAAQLDELTDGTGDGCVAVASTKLDGVSDRVVLHADHLDLIRAPWSYPEPGPIVTLPWILERIRPPEPKAPRR